MKKEGNMIIHVEWPTGREWERGSRREREQERGTRREGE